MHQCSCVCLLMPVHLGLVNHDAGEGGRALQQMRQKAAMCTCRLGILACSRREQ